MSKRATLAAEFSSSHWSIKVAISLRRLAAWLRRVNSKLCRPLREAVSKNSQGAGAGNGSREFLLRGQA